MTRPCGEALLRGRNVRYFWPIFFASFCPNLVKLVILAGSRGLEVAQMTPLCSAKGHTTLNTPVLVRSLKLSSVGSSQYLDGWPPGMFELHRFFKCWSHYWGCSWDRCMCPRPLHVEMHGIYACRNGNYYIAKNVILFEAQKMSQKSLFKHFGAT